MRIVFLDFDGVLNSLPWLGAGAGEGWQGAGEARALNPENIAHLNRIVSVTSARVVISSSWRHGRPLARLGEMLVERGFQGTALGRTPDHVPCMDPLSKRMHGCRGDEIQAWLGRAELVLTTGGTANVLFEVVQNSGGTLSVELPPSAD